MKDLIKENAKYKLFLIELLDYFEEVYKATEDKNLRKYLTELSISIEKVLKITDRHTEIKGNSNDKK